MTAAHGMRHAHVANTATPPSLTHPPHTHTHPATRQTKTSQDVQEPPAKIATPASGSDVAARPSRPWLRAAVLQAPAVTLKMSTTLEGLLFAAQGMRHAHVANTATPPSLTHPPHTQTHPATCQTNTSQDVQEPPAKIATPASGSDVAARPRRAWLRAAVLQVPAVTLKMSTTLE